ncbi:MAG: hypothetical protein R3A79_08085 [Nannocystaceae bacterium]
MHSRSESHEAPSAAPPPVDVDALSEEDEASEVVEDVASDVVDDDELSEEVEVEVEVEV